MLENTAEKLTQMLVDKAELEACEKEIYLYGIELIISTISCLLVILLQAYLLSNFTSGLVFIMVFAPLRTFTGGYHANTYKNCFIITNSAYLLIFLLSKILGRIVPITIWWGILLLTMHYIYKNAPMVNERQPISEEKQKICREKTKYILFIDAIGIVVLMIRNYENMVMAILSICLVAAFMYIAKK